MVDPEPNQVLAVPERQLTQAKDLPAIGDNIARCMLVPSELDQQLLSAIMVPQTVEALAGWFLLRLLRSLLLVEHVVQSDGLRQIVLEV